MGRTVPSINDVWNTGHTHPFRCPRLRVLYLVKRTEGKSKSRCEPESTNTWGGGRGAFAMLVGKNILDWNAQPWSQAQLCVTLEKLPNLSESLWLLICYIAQRITVALPTSQSRWENQLPRDGEGVSCRYYCYSDSDEAALERCSESQ